MSREAAHGVYMTVTLIGKGDCHGLSGFGVCEVALP